MFGGSDTIMTDWSRVRDGSRWDIGELDTGSYLRDTMLLWDKKEGQSNTRCKDWLDAVMHDALLTAVSETISTRPPRHSIPAR